MHCPLVKSVLAYSKVQQSLRLGLAAFVAGVSVQKPRSTHRDTSLDITGMIKNNELSAQSRDNALPFHKPSLNAKYVVISLLFSPVHFCRIFQYCYFRLRILIKFQFSSKNNLMKIMRKISHAPVSIPTPHSPFPV